MKHITKLAFIASFGAAVALADDSQLQNRLSLQRSQIPEASSTVAVYSNRQGAGPATPDERPEFRVEMRANAHGQTHDVYVSAK